MFCFPIDAVAFSNVPFYGMKYVSCMTLDITLDISFMFGQADSCFVWRFELKFTYHYWGMFKFISLYIMMADIFLVKLPCGGCQLDSVMAGQNWFQIWFGAVRQQGIIWANADPALCYLPWVNILQWEWKLLVQLVVIPVSSDQHVMGPGWACGGG